jgi:hypothetical protein
MEAQQFETARVTPVPDWRVTKAEVTLRLTDSDARRIVRALEETSVRLGRSPSGAGMASPYIRLAGVVREQSSISR